MPSTYSSRLRFELIADGEQSGTWGQTTNRNTGTLVETAIAGYRTIAMPDANYTLTTSNGLDDDARYAMLNFTGTLTATRDITAPAVSKLYVVKNQTNQTLNVKTAAGAARAVPTGKTVMVFIDGSDAFDVLNDLTALSVSGTSALGVTSTTNLSYTGTLTGGTGVVNIGSGQLVKDAAGNLGLGVTPSAWDSTFKALQLGISGSIFGRTGNETVVLGSGVYFDAVGAKYLLSGNNASFYQQASGAHIWNTAPSGTAGNPITFTQAMTLTQGGNLLVGRTSGVYQLDVAKSTDGEITRFSFTGGTKSPFIGVSAQSDGLMFLDTQNSDSTVALGIRVSGAEGARLTSARYFKASNTGSYGGVAGIGDLSANLSHNFQSDADSPTIRAINANTGAVVTNFQSALATGATGLHIQALVNASSVFQVLANGSVQNATNSYGAISDRKIKESIVDAPSYLEKFMRVRFRNFNLIGSDMKQFGVVAQELEEVFPGLVDSTPDVDAEGNDLGTVTKSVKYSVLAQMQGKVIQELNAKVDEQQVIIDQQNSVLADLLARVAALEAK